MVRGARKKVDIKRNEKLQSGSFLCTCYHIRQEWYVARSLNFFFWVRFQDFFSPSGSTRSPQMYIYINKCFSIWKSLDHFQSFKLQWVADLNRSQNLWPVSLMKWRIERKDISGFFRGVERTEICKIHEWCLKVDISSAYQTQIAWHQWFETD